MWRGSAWRSEHGAGFGRHVARALYRLGDGTWTLVHAESGLWLIETATLARRARLRTGAIAAVDVSRDGSSIAYAECEPPPRWALQPQIPNGDCELIVLRFPDLREVRRVTVASAAQVRFAADGSVLAISRDRFGAPILVSIASEQPPWSVAASSSSVDAVPINANRVAYNADGNIMIVDRDQGVVYVGVPRARTLGNPVMDMLGTGRDSGPLLYDAAGDRVLRPVNQVEVLVIERASSDTPAFHEPIARAELLATGLDVVPNRVPAGPSVVATLYGGGIVLRVGDKQVAYSADFADAEDRWHASATRFDVLLWRTQGGRVHLRRVELTSASLDVTAQGIGSFASDYDDHPVTFSSGDRAFVAATPTKRLRLIRLARGAALSPPEWTELPAPGWSDGPVGGPDRYTYEAPDHTVVEIGPDSARSIAR